MVVPDDVLVVCCTAIRSCIALYRVPIKEFHPDCVSCDLCAIVDAIMLFLAMFDDCFCDGDCWW